MKEKTKTINIIYPHQTKQVCINRCSKTGLLFIESLFRTSERRRIIIEQNRFNAISLNFNKVNKKNLNDHDHYESKRKIMDKSFLRNIFYRKNGRAERPR